MYMIIAVLTWFLPSQELTGDPGFQTSMASHAEELAALETGTDHLAAAFTARAARITATLETMDPQLLASGSAGVEKRGSRYIIDGSRRPDLLLLEELMVMFLTDSRHEEIRDDLLQRGFRVGDLNSWEKFSDKDEMDRYESETREQYILSHNTNPKITREFLESEGSKDFFLQHPELLTWNDAELLAFHELEGDAYVLAQVGWAADFLQHLTPHSRKVVMDYIGETLMPHCSQSYGFGANQQELNWMLDNLGKLRKEWGLEP